MKHIGEVLKEYYKAHPGNEEPLWRSVDRMAEELSGRGERATELLYRAVHEDFYGPHYNKDLAEIAVEKMFHKSASGETIHGGRWSIAQAQELFAAYKGKMKSPKDNVYDLYVALNAMYSDLGEQFKKDFGEEWEKKLADYTVEFWFQDDDAPDGKIWRYMTAMQE